jgi:DNA mismatch endonuclease, patch repair protein
MTDVFTKADRSRVMRAVKSSGTSAEKRVAELVSSLRFKYETHAPDLVGKPDFVFRRRKVAVFVHGCFWHVHTCAAGLAPTSNVHYWEQKRERNRLRDQNVRRCLRRQGWRTLVIWECSLRNAERF